MGRTATPQNGQGWGEIPEEQAMMTRAQGLRQEDAVPGPLTASVSVSLVVKETEGYLAACL